MRPLSTGERSVRVMIVESELDAILLHQEAGDLVQVIALGSASARPEQDTVQILRDAETILLSLDNDPAGIKNYGLGGKTTSRRLSAGMLSRAKTLLNHGKTG